jgi:hypothetical protein
MKMSGNTKTAARIDEDAHEAPTRDHDHLNIANAPTATTNESPVIAPEAVNPKIENATAVETGVHDLPTTAAIENPQPNHQLPTKIEEEPTDRPDQPPNPPKPPSQTQTTLSPPS